MGVEVATQAGVILVANDADLLAVAGQEGLRVVRPADLWAS